MPEPASLWRALLPAASVLFAAAITPGCREGAAAGRGAEDTGAASDDSTEGGAPIDFPGFSTEWAVATPVLGDWVSCGATGTPIADAKVSVRGGRLRRLGDPNDPAQFTVLATAVVTVSGSLDLQNLPARGGGNWQCALNLFGPLELTFPPPTAPPIPIAGTPLTLRFQARPIGVLELGVEDFLNGTGSIPFEMSVEIGAAAFGGYGGRAVPYSRVLSAKFSPLETSFSGAFKGYVEGNFGAGLTLLFNEVATLSLNGYFEPNFSWDLPLTGCDMTYQLVSRRVGEACIGAQTPEAFPGPPLEAGACGQFKNEPTLLLQGDASIFRLEPDHDLKVAPGETAALPLFANDTCRGPSFISHTPDCPAYACSVDEPGRQGVTFRAVDPDGRPRAPGIEQGQYCVRSTIDQRERCAGFTVTIACPPDAKWSEADRACLPCGSPEECSCEAPRAWNGTACLCPATAPVFDAAAGTCAPCAVAGSAYDPATGQCACDAPRQSDGFRCQCPREAPNFVAAANACEVCPANMVHDGQRCVCVEPARLEGGACVPPCQPPLRWDGYECRCPPGVGSDECYPEPECPPPSVLDNGICACPPGASCTGGGGGGGPGDGGTAPTSCTQYECSFRMNRGNCSAPSEEDGDLVTATVSSCGTPLALAEDVEGCGKSDRFHVTDPCGVPQIVAITSCCNFNTELSCRPIGSFGPSCN
jgi:hypothetical protein